ncbi:MAG TPA: metallophosphoesterase, partial [Gaiellaceae bacterium]|nr:metallophosphoesterase [Gaiellaceae bacterium]
MKRLAAGVVAAAAAGAAWGTFEAGWVRRRVLELELPRLGPELDGLRIAHLSDFHLGLPSRGETATRRAVEWVAGRRPDLVCVTGDLVSHPRGVEPFRQLLRALGRPYVVLGNHDVAVSRDPFSRAAELHDLSEEGILLCDEAHAVVIRGQLVQLVGLDPRSYRRAWRRAAELADPRADLRLLLCHFPGIARRLAPGTFDLILAGHLHDGQIAIPYPGGKVPLT